MNKFFKIFSPGFSSVFENLQDPVSILEDGAFVECNYATLKMLGMKNKDELIGKTPWDISPELQPDKTNSVEKAKIQISKCFESGSNRFQWCHSRPDGSVFFAEILLTRYSMTDDRTIFVMWRDITETYFIAEQLRQVQKMESVGELAGGIAHDFNNLIGGITVCTDKLSRMLADNSEALDELKLIRYASEKAAHLTKQLMNFSRKPDISNEEINLHSLISKTIEMISSSIGNNIKISKDFYNENIVVRGDSSQLQNAFINLAFNAKDAMPQGGTLVFKTSLSEIKNQADIPAGIYTEIQVKDTGAGIDKNDIGRIFEPFYTTKERGKGTGLGLSSVKMAVKDFKGQISVDSVVGKGTVFHLYLPVGKSKL